MIQHGKMYPNESHATFKFSEGEFITNFQPAPNTVASSVEELLSFVVDIIFKGPEKCSKLFPFREKYNLEQAVHEHHVHYHSQLIIHKPLDCIPFIETGEITFHPEFPFEQHQCVRN